MTRDELTSMLYNVIDDHGLEQDYCYSDDCCGCNVQYLDAFSMARAVAAALLKEGIVIDPEGCPYCGGSGEGTTGPYSVCNVCNGKGKIT